MAPNRKCETGCRRPAIHHEPLTDMAFCDVHVEVYDGLVEWVLRTITHDPDAPILQQLNLTNRQHVHA